MELKLVSPIPVSVNHYLGQRVVMRNGKHVSMSYKTAEAVKYQKYFKEYVTHEAEAQGWEFADNRYSHLYADAWFYFPQTHMDTNNYWKIMFDAITETKCVWVDDSVVCERVQGIWYDTDNPRIELTIHPVDYIGVFEDASQLEEFCKSCIECKRYKRNCSLLRRAKEGRIQPEIHDVACLYKNKGEC